MELPVARLQLFQALEVGRELVGGLDQRQHLWVILCQQAGKGRTQRRRQHGGQTAHGVFLHGLVGAAEGGAGILDGGGQVAGEDLRRVVVQGHGGHPAGVDGPAELVPADHRQGMGQHGHHVGVLLHVLRHGASHEAPAADVLHAGDVGEKRVGHGAPPAPWQRESRGWGFLFVTLPSSPPAGFMVRWEHRTPCVHTGVIL